VVTAVSPPQRARHPEVGAAVRHPRELPAGHAGGEAAENTTQRGQAR
jgi:hypothetical protein